MCDWVLKFIISLSIANTICFFFQSIIWVTSILDSTKLLLLYGIMCMLYCTYHVPKYTALNLLEIEATKDALRNIFPFVESLTKHFTSFLSWWKKCKHKCQNIFIFHEYNLNGQDNCNLHSMHINIIAQTCINM